MAHERQAPVAKKAEADAPEIPLGPGKGHATPSRREREAANKRPLVPTDRRAARAASRTQGSADRERARVGMLNGEERYLPANERGPQRKFVRDSLDARFLVLEFTIPLAIVSLILATVAGNSPIANWAYVVLYAFIAVAIIDVFILWRGLRKKVVAKFGSVDRGHVYYVVRRGMMVRRFRTPKPTVKRGEHPS
jgi:Protein of unknown function (DUF3043)